MSDPKDVFCLTKILCTVGPATADAGVLLQLISAGASAFRINFSHGTPEDHLKSLRAIREAEEKSGKYVGVLGDLCGPKLRIGSVQSPGVMLENGDLVAMVKTPTFTPSARPAEGLITFCTNTPEILDDVMAGERVFINDGEVRLVVQSCVGQGTPDCKVTLKVLGGSMVSTGKGINLPDSRLKLPAITQRDRACAKWALDNHLDYLALSFVRNGDDVKELRALLTSLSPGAGAKIPIIAKIEKPQAVAEVDAILDVSDGIMVARGDLGVEMDLAQVPVIQKRLITAAHEHGKQVIVATQMLQSMIESPVPTRAEVSDVANAIFDGADSVMLSGETAVGKYPLAVVEMMARVARETQGHLSETTLLGNHIDPGAVAARANFKRQIQVTKYRTAALARAVTGIVVDLEAKLVINWSEAGGGARFLSLNRLGVPILAFSSSKEALRKMSLFFGVVPCYLERPRSTEEFLTKVDWYVTEAGYAKKGDATVVVKGDPIGTIGVTNEIRVHYVGDAR
jgi:pyruvate kinase